MKKLLLRCWLENKPVEIMYLDQRGYITQRTIFVKRIENNQVIAFCTLRKQQRTFQLDNILAAQKGNKHHEAKQTYTRVQFDVGVQPYDATRACRSITTI